MQLSRLPFFLFLPIFAQWSFSFHGNLIFYFSYKNSKLPSISIFSNNHLYRPHHFDPKISAQQPAYSHCLKCESHQSLLHYKYFPLSTWSDENLIPLSSDSEHGQFISCPLSLKHCNCLGHKYSSNESLFQNDTSLIMDDAKYPYCCVKSWESVDFIGMPTILSHDNFPHLFNVDCLRIFWTACSR